MLYLGRISVQREKYFLEMAQVCKTQYFSMLYDVVYGVGGKRRRPEKGGEENRGKEKEVEEG